MQCQECNGDLTQDDEIDNTIIAADSCQINFMCVNEDCKAHFIIEFSPIDINPA